MHIMHKKPLSILLLYAIVTTSTCALSTKVDVFFSPDDNIEKKLINYIKGAKHTIHAAVYMITSANIAKALIEAKKREVDVQVITDESCMVSRYGKIHQLESENIEVFCLKHHHTKERFSTPLMHHKFAIIDDTLWTGSFNWTRSANTINQENVIVTNSPSAYRRYQQQFSLLKKRCFNIHETKKEIEYEPGYIEKFSTEVYQFLHAIKEKIIG